MKFIIIGIFLTTFAMANEIDRMESIVADIKHLRSDYSACIKDLKIKNTKENTLKISTTNQMLKLELEEKNKKLDEYRELLEKEKKTNVLYSTQIATFKNKKNDNPNNKLQKNLKSKEMENEIQYKKNIDDLKKKYEKIIKNKDNLIDSLKNKIKLEEKSIIVEKEVCKDDNPFPNLMMKESSKKEEKESKKLEKIKYSEARTYRLNKDSNIYDEVNGSIVFQWENKTSFTSTQMTEEWLKITGYFVDKKWQKAKKSLWLKKLDATRR